MEGARNELGRGIGSKAEHLLSRTLQREGAIFETTAVCEPRGLISLFAFGVYHEPEAVPTIRILRLSHRAFCS